MSLIPVNAKILSMPNTIPATEQEPQSEPVENQILKKIDELVDDVVKLNKLAMAITEDCMEIQTLRKSALNLLAGGKPVDNSETEPPGD